MRGLSIIIIVEGINLLLKILLSAKMKNRRLNMNEHILECQKISKKFGRKQILQDVSLTLDGGDILAFIGPNGAGKTTTIKLILGLQSIDKGTVVINGYDVKKDFVNAIKRVGAIVENPDHYMYMSGYKNLKLIANLYDNISEERIKEVVKITGLSKRINDKVSKYSLGMRQRLGIASALLHKPNLLILDEPTNGLDPEGIKELRELLVKLAKEENMAILISSHNLSELESFCNKVCIIQAGKIVETTKVDQLKHENEKDTYIIELSSTKKLKSIFPENSVVIDDTHVKVSASKEEIAHIIKEIVAKEVAIYEVKRQEISLEEAFLKKTGGNIID